MLNLSLEHILLAVSILMVISVFASTVSSSKLGVPTLPIFLAIGMLAGSEGFGGIYFDNVQLAQSLGSIALVFILFSGGFDTDTTHLKEVLVPGILLSTVGVIMSAFFVGLFAFYFLGLSFLESMLLGSIISSTDAAAVFSILRAKNLHLHPKLKTLLEFESGSNDPTAIFLTITFISLITSQKASIGDFFTSFIQQGVLGVFFGVIMSLAIQKILQRLNLGYRGLYPALTFGFALFTYAFTSLVGGNGFLAVYVCGLTLAMSDFKFKKGLVVFHDSVAWIMQILIFVTLGLLVFPSQLVTVAKEGIITAFVLFFIARPISVVACLAPFKMPAREVAMTSWVGLRGAAPIVLSTFPLLANTDSAQYIFNIVFFIVLLSVILQGSSLPFVARLLKVDIPAPEETEDD
ncbi:cell volume regulation protein A [Parelusimicrobium proximum]|uniref:potassium/proton antiporter n=1 Tax=Parelusimicrobium proximum TaxID=3228953 RepID=UPI003D16889B